MTASAGEAFPKRVRLRRRREYLAVQRGGGRVGTRHFVVYARRNGDREARLGITVSRKVGKAVARNRIKRLVREAFRRNRHKMPRGFDVVFVARQGQPTPAYAEVVAELLSAAKRAPKAKRRPRRR